MSDSKEPEKKPGAEATAAATAAKKKKKKQPKKGEPEEEPELSEEDQRLKEDIDLLVQRCQDSDVGVQKLAIETLKSEVRTATGSMTSFPKPLKFLRPHYPALSEFFKTKATAVAQKQIADLLSVLAMTMGDEAKKDALTFKLQGAVDDLDAWGHDYVRNLAGEVAAEHNRRVEEAEKGGMEVQVQEDDLLSLLSHIVVFHMRHNAEPDACDLLIEMNRVGDVVKYLAEVDAAPLPSSTTAAAAAAAASTSSTAASPTPHTVSSASGPILNASAARKQRVCNYLTRCADYFPSPEDVSIRHAVMEVCRTYGERVQALVWALRINDQEAVKRIFSEAKSPAERRQLSFLLARHGAAGAAEIATTAGAEAGDDADECERLSAIASNQKLSELFLLAAQELNITEPRDPEDILKPPSSSTAPPPLGGGSGLDTARQTLALSFVNAFANCGFGANDALLSKEGPKWILKHKDQGLMSATASLGLLMLWDVEALSTIDKYIYSTEPYVRAGALLATGAVNATVRSEVDPALALIQEHLAQVAPRDTMIRVGGLIGLGLAYAGTARQDLAETLLPYLEDPSNALDVRSSAALALGLVFAGTCKGEVLEPIIAALTDFTQPMLENPHTRFICLSLGLLVMGCGEKCEVAAEMAKTLPAPASEYTVLCIQTCAYAATGNVLKVQELLNVIVEHYKIEKEKEAEKAAAPQPAAGATGAAAAGAAPATGAASAANSDKKEPESGGLHPQGVAVLGIALTAMGEEVGDEMATRAFDHVMQYGDIHARRAVPLALGLLSISNPRVGVVDTLHKLSHDADVDVAACAIISLGLVGAGTNNSRIAGALQQLAAYHAKDANLLFAVRLSQGLIHLGKGTLTLSPLHSDRSLLCLPAAAGLLVVLHACLDVRGTILGRMHYLLFCIAASVYPRVLVTIDDTPAMAVVRTPVRVGQAVDVAGQAGRPKAITGFQTHTTPVLIGFGERSELATDDYNPLTPFLEGPVILTKNTDKQ